MIQILTTFDPGGTTGWCRFKKLLGPKWFLSEFGQFDVEDLVEVVDLIDPDSMVVYEQIQVLHLGFDPVGLKVIGAIELECATLNVRPKAQSPMILSGPTKWPELDQARKWFRKAPHARDAFYHGVVYLGLNNVDLNVKPQVSS